MKRSYPFNLILEFGADRYGYSLTKEADAMILTPEQVTVPRPSGLYPSPQLDRDALSALCNELKAQRDPAYEQLTNLKPIPLFPGVTAISGASATGKTTLLENIAFASSNADVVFAHVVYAEPEEYALVDTAELADVVASSLCGDSSVLLIDSFREFIFAGTGATGKGGVNMGIFNTLTRLDILGREVGMPIVIVLNMLSNDPDALEFYDNAIRGSVTTAVRMLALGRAAYSSRYIKNREWTNVSFSVLSDSDRASIPNTTTY